MHPRQRAVRREVDGLRPAGRIQMTGDAGHRGLVVDVDPALAMLRPGAPERDERERPLTEELDPIVLRHRLQDDDRVDLPGRDQLLVQRDLGRALGRCGDVDAVPGDRRRLHQTAEQAVQEAAQPRVLVAERLVIEVERQPDHLTATRRQRARGVVRGVAEFLDGGAHGPDRRVARPGAVRSARSTPSSPTPRPAGPRPRPSSAVASAARPTQPPPSVPLDPGHPGHGYVDRPQFRRRRRTPVDLGTRAVRHYEVDRSRPGTFDQDARFAATVHQHDRPVGVTHPGSLITVCPFFT